jgi:hypothetical protein
MDEMLPGRVWRVLSAIAPMTPAPPAKATMEPGPGPDRRSRSQRLRRCRDDLIKDAGSVFAFVQIGLSVVGDGVLRRDASDHWVCGDHVGSWVMSG